MDTRGFCFAFYTEMKKKYSDNIFPEVLDFYIEV